jgi:hypothetical protein
MHCDSCYRHDVSVLTLTDELPGMLSWSCCFLGHAPALVEMMKTRALEVALLKRVTFVWRSAAAVWPVSLSKQQPTLHSWLSSTAGRDGSRVRARLFVAGVCTCANLVAGMHVSLTKSVLVHKAAAQCAARGSLLTLARNDVQKQQCWCRTTTA